MSRTGILIAIHGAGHHSAGGAPLIKPALLERLARRAAASEAELAGASAAASSQSEAAVGGAGAKAVPPPPRVCVLESYVPDFDAVAKCHNTGTTSVYFRAASLPLPTASPAPPAFLVVRNPALAAGGAPEQRLASDAPAPLPVAHAALAAVTCCGCLLC